MCIEVKEGNKDASLTLPGCANKNLPRGASEDTPGKWDPSSSEPTRHLPTDAQAREIEERLGVYDE